MNTRARFEEIWPVPEGVCWSPVFGAYVCAHGSPVKIECMELNLRLDTFTRCQETTDVYVSLVDELVGEIEKFERAKDLWLPEYVEAGRCEDAAALHTMRGSYLFTLDRAKQIMEQKK